MPDGVNTNRDEVFVSVTDNRNIYFTRFEENGSTQILKSEYNAGEYQDPILQEFDPDTLRISNPCIAPDESYIIFASRSPDGYGNADLYIAFPDGLNRWKEITNLGPEINSAQSEFAPSISIETGHLLFTSERRGMVPELPEGRPPGDIYAVPLDSLPQNRH